MKLRSNFVVTVFNIKGNQYRLLTYIDYEGELIDVLEVAAHAEYSKDRWKSRC